jgi:hypothetical protein
VRQRVIDERAAAVDGRREEVRHEQSDSGTQARPHGGAAQARAEEEEQCHEAEGEQDLRDLRVRLQDVLEPVVTRGEVVRPAEEVVVGHSSTERRDRA